MASIFSPSPPHPSAMTGRCTVSVLCAKFVFFCSTIFLNVHLVGKGPLGEQQQISTGVGDAVQRLREGRLDGEKP